MTIYVRSIFRVAELKSGFDGKLANQEVTFMILEGAMVAIASMALTAFHPGPVFKDSWKSARAREVIGRLGPNSFTEAKAPMAGA